MNAATKHSINSQSLPRSILSSGPGSATIARSIWFECTTLVIGVSAAMRWIVATATGLSDTEAYYVSWARTPALSYYDHPPLVAWSTWLVERMGSWLGGAATTRIGPVVYAAVFQGLLYHLTKRLFSPRAGFFAVAIVAAIPVFFYTGFLVNPEALLAPFWVLFLLLLLDLRDHDDWWRPLALGAVVGLAFLAKYSAVLALPVTLLFVVSSEAKRWLRRPSFYAAGLVALAVASPVVVWNAMRGWPSLRLHTERLADPSAETFVHALWRVGMAQLAYFSPVILPALAGVAVYAAVRSKADPRYRFLLTTSVPILAFLLTTMVRAADSEPHWTMIGYMPLVVAAGGVLDETSGTLRRVARAVFGAALLVSALAASLYAVHVHTPMLAKRLPRYDAASDPVNETIGWDRVRSAVRAHAAALGPNTVVVGAHNVLCGHLQIALDDTPPVYCASPRTTEFDFNGRRRPPGDAPIVFVDSERYPADLDRALPDRLCRLIEEVEIDRSGLHAARYRLHACGPGSVGSR